MATLNYAILVKDDALREKTRKRQRLKSILSVLCIVLAFAMLFVVPHLYGDNILLTLLPLIFLAIFAVFEGYGIFFHSWLTRITKTQDLKKDDPIDSAILSLSESYWRFMSLCKKIIFFNIVTCFAVFVILVVLVATKTLSSSTTAVIFMVVMVLGILFYVVGITILRQRLSAKSIVQLRVLEPHFNALDKISQKQINKQNNIFTNMSAAQKQLTYQFPDEALRQKNTKIVGLVMLPAFACGIIMGLVMSGTFKEPLSIILASLAVLVFWASLIGVIFYSLQLRNAQKKLLEEDSEKNALYLEHARITKQNSDKTNKVALILGIVIILITWTLGIIGYINEPTNEEGQSRLAGLIVGLGFGSLFLWTIPIIPYIIFSYSRCRKKLIPIEKEIDNMLTLPPPTASDPFIESPDKQNMDNTHQENKL